MTDTFWRDWVCRRKLWGGVEVGYLGAGEAESGVWYSQGIDKLVFASPRTQVAVGINIRRTFKTHL